MDTMTLIYIIVAFTIGVVVGWLTMVTPAGGRDLTRDETRRLYNLIEKAMDMPRGYTVTLWYEGAVVDKVTIHEEYRRW